MKISKVIAKAKSKESGAAMVLVAMSMVVLLGMAAFGTDLAWFYLNASRVQRAADAGALGGVVWLPSQSGTAITTAGAPSPSRTVMTTPSPCKTSPRLW